MKRQTGHLDLDQKGQQVWQNVTVLNDLTEIKESYCSPCVHSPSGWGTIPLSSKSRGGLLLYETEK